MNSKDPLATDNENFWLQMARKAMIYVAAAILIPKNLEKLRSEMQNNYKIIEINRIKFIE